jgi:hypothetical protein
MVSAHRSGRRSAVVRCRVVVGEKKAVKNEKTEKSNEEGGIEKEQKEKDDTVLWKLVPEYNNEIGCFLTPDENGPIYVRLKGCGIYLFIYIMIIPL